jgi:DNA-binding beta-propeller fold protein YncE/mono/diheme cytochrome c family protein
MTTQHYASVRATIALAAAICVTNGCRAREREAPPPPPPAVVAVAPAAPAPPRVPTTIESDADAREGSSIVVASINDRSVAFVADEDENAVHTLDLALGREVARTPLAGRPTRLLVFDGRLAVTLRDSAIVVLLAAESIEKPLFVTTTLATADEPIALAKTADGAQLWVASGWGRMLEGLAREGWNSVGRIPLGREPRAVAIAEGGKHAFVGYMTEHELDVVDLSTLKLDRTLRRRSDMDSAFDFGDLGWDAHLRQTFALVRVSGANELVVRPHVEVRSGNTAMPVFATGSSYGNLHDLKRAMFNIAVVDAKTRTPLEHRPRPSVDECPLPRAAVAIPASSTVWIACLGTDRVIAIDVQTNAVTARLAAAGGPHGLAFDPAGKSLLVATLFDRAVRVVHLPTTTQTTISLSHVEGLGLSAAVAEGRRMFHTANDPRIARDGRACASCHPDGRDDGLVWPTVDGPRRTMFLAGRVARGSGYGWEAKHATIAEHVVATVANLGGSGLPAEDREKIAAYVLALSPPPRTARPLTASEQHGAEIFSSGETGCSTCHIESLGYTDATAHDVGTAYSLDRCKSFVTPSLRFFRGNAALFHDGSFKSARELLRDTSHKMGTTQHLSKNDLADLEAYLFTL